MDLSRITNRVTKSISGMAGLASIAATSVLAVGELRAIVQVAATLVGEGSIAGAWSAFWGMWSGLRSVGAVFTVGGIGLAIIIFTFGLARAVNLVVTSYILRRQRSVTLTLRDEPIKLNLEEPNKIRAAIEGARKERAV